MIEFLWGTLMSEWDDFLNEIRAACDELGCTGEAWFRGQSDHEWSIIPSLYRKPKWVEKERALFLEFRKISQLIFKEKNKSSEWEYLFDMQHYGIPTRLVDWTTVLGVALSFVLYDESASEKDSAIFVLNPHKLNLIDGKDEVVSIPESKNLEYEKNYLDNTPTTVQATIAVRPGFQNSRIASQKGVFTIHGKNDEPFEVFAKDCFKKVILKTNAKSSAKEFLKWGNLDEYTLFPDIVGMSLHIRRKILGDD